MASFDDIIAACIILLLSGTSFFAYVIASAAIYRVRKATKNPFYILLFALGISDSTMLALFLFYSTTATLLQRSPFGPEFDSLFCGTLCNLTYFTSLALLVNIALNRYSAICSKDLAKKVHDKSKIKMIIAGCCAFGMVSAIAQLTPCCSLRYYESEYTWSYDLDLAGNAVFVWYDRSSNLFTFFCLVVSYTLIFKKVRETRNAAHPSLASSSSQTDHVKAKADVRLALQSALVAGLMITFGLGFTIIPLLTSNKWCNLLSSILYIAAIGVHPFVYIGFNKQIRRQASELLRCKPISSSVQPDVTHQTVATVFARTGRDRRSTTLPRDILGGCTS